MRYQIFIVEDHPVIRAIYHELIARAPSLQLSGEATTAAEALQALRSQRPHLILLDLILPDNNGTALLQKLKKLYPRLPVLVVSGEDAFIYARLARQAGADAYLDKMHAGDRLIDTILELLKATDATQNQAESP